MVLEECARQTPAGSLMIVAQGGGGQVWFSGGEIVFAACDDQPDLRTALELSGAADSAALSELARTSRYPLRVRGAIPPPVAAVARDLTESALATLLALSVGRARLAPGEIPPLGVLVSQPLEEWSRSATLLHVRARAARLGRRGTWQAAPHHQEVRLSAEEWQLVSAMLEPATPVELARSTGRTFESVRALLTGLADRGLLRRIGDEPDTVAALPPAPVRVEPPVRAASPAKAPTKPSSRSSALRRLIGAVRVG
jgi:hypothetical protein